MPSVLVSIVGGDSLSEVRQLVSEPVTASTNSMDLSSDDRNHLVSGQEHLSKESHEQCHDSKTMEAPVFQMEDWLILIAVSTSFLVIGMNFAFLAPILPFEFANMNITAMESAVILCSYEFVQFFSFPVAGSIVPVIGFKRSLTYGCVLTGLSVMTFAGITFIQTGIAFVISAVACRFVAGFASAVVLTSNFAVLMSDFGNRIPTAMSVSFADTIYTIGMMLGPSFGGFMYQSCGFAVPFIVIASILLLCGFMFMILLRSDAADLGTHDDGGGEILSLIQILLHPCLLINFASMFSGTLIMGYIDATMTIEMQHFDLSPVQVSGGFMLGAAVQLISSSVWGVVIAKVKHERVFALIGQLLVISACIISGPMWPISFGDSVALVLVRQVLYGLAQGPIFAASVTVGQQELIRAGFPNNKTNSSIYSAYTLSVLVLGGFCGILLGGASSDSVSGFRTGSFILFSAEAVLFSIYTMFAIYSLMRERGERERITDS